MVLQLPSNFSVVVPIVAGVGNALMTLPMVRQLKSRANAGQVTIVARIDAMAEPFRRGVDVDEVIVARGPRSMIGALRASRADLLVVPFPSNRWEYSMLAAASGAGQTLLHDYPVGRLAALHFIGTRVPAVRGIHDVEQNLRLLRAMDVEPDLTESPRFVLREDDRRSAAAMLRGTESFIAIHVGSAKTILAKAKRWPTANYAALIESLRTETGIEPIMLEGPDESGVAGGINAPLSRACPVVRLVGNLGEAAAVLERASFYVGSDSGLAHLAAAVGKRTITIFAPADPDRVCPYGNRELVVKPQKACSPCFLYPWQATKPKMCCGKNGEPMCITEVTVEQVMEKVRSDLVRERV
ncbi:MAG: glycosyltransferase family 9 protein [Anaerolineae bacterium]|nr:glycosyltransferase family 9 protein [Phycisphaerae bacterium]